jgi:gluconolactonase
MTKKAVQTGIEAVEEEMRRIVPADGEPRCIADGLKFTEGPAWLHREGCLLFSDIPADTIYRWQEARGLAVWRRPSNQANGNTVDHAGRVLTCEHGSRRLTRSGPDGTSAEVLAERYGQRRLNSPNDVVVKADGTVWFTDPPYGIRPDQMEQPASYVFRLDEGAAEPVPVTGVLSRPNGLCFSLDESKLYVADSDPKIHHVRLFDVQADGTLTGNEIFAVIAPGVPDGMRLDADGRLYVAAGDGVQVYTPAGRLLGKIRTPEPASNCTFGGPGLRTLYITARTKVWAVDLKVTGALVAAGGSWRLQAGCSG